MAILGDKVSQPTEVRLRKFPTTDHGSPYFEEYADADVLRAEARDKSKKLVTRYIVPESSTYVIEITLKKGYDFGKYDGGLSLKLYDRKDKEDGSIKSFHERVLMSSLKHDGKRVLDVDKTYYIRSIPLKLVAEDGEDLPTTFWKLRPDKPSVEQLGVSGHLVKTVEDLSVELIQYSKPRPDVEDDAPVLLEAKFQRKMGEYKQLADTLLYPPNHANYGSMPPATRVIGSEEAATLLEPPERTYTSEHVTRRYFKFHCRTPDCINKNNLVKVPLQQEVQPESLVMPEELQPWDSLNDTQHQACFKLLQEVDKKKTLEQKWAEAGVRSQRKNDKIYNILFKEGEIPNRWRPWSRLLSRERKLMFEELQVRRKFFERGEYPPEPAVPASIPSTPSNRLASNASPSSARSPLQSITPSKAPVPTSGIYSGLKRFSSSNSPSKVSTMSAATRMAAVSPTGHPTTPSRNLNSPVPAILIVDDSDDSDPDDDIPLSIRRGLLKFLVQTLNKSVTTERTFELPSVTDTDATSTAEQTPKRSGTTNTSPSKRVKLEPGNSAPQSLVDEDVELRSLKEQVERENEELEQEMRVRELTRSRNEKLARIAELEAKKTGTT